MTDPACPNFPTGRRPGETLRSGECAFVPLLQSRRHERGCRPETSGQTSIPRVTDAWQMSLSDMGPHSNPAAECRHQRQSGIGNRDGPSRILSSGRSSHRGHDQHDHDRVQAGCMSLSSQKQLSDFPRMSSRRLSARQQLEQALVSPSALAHLPLCSRIHGSNRLQKRGCNILVCGASVVHNSNPSNSNASRNRIISPPPRITACDCLETAAGLDGSSCH
ncbi:MAG: hypothetical protein Ct9H300mP1_38180 [Planctomycetaceae bacterium]|nr:MAG: hypothetical protein Ct9H300mP1_38180 [Planctomycetaceae bacterium]